MSLRIGIEKWSCMRSIVSSSSRKAFLQAKFPNGRLRLTLLVQLGSVSAAIDRERERGLQSNSGSTLCVQPTASSCYCSPFYTTSFFPSLIVCLLTLARTVEAECLHFLFSIHKDSFYFLLRLYKTC